MEPTTRQYLLPGIAQHLKGLTTTLEQVGEPHRSAGRRLADWTAKNYREGELLPLVVVCTGNSRRSMLGAMMGNVSAAYYGLPEVRYFSGGTAPSAFNSRTITTLQAIGFEVAPIGEEALRGEPELPNPKYRVRWGTIQPGSPSLPEAVEFSKVFSNYPKTGCNPRKIQDLRAFSDSYLVPPPIRRAVLPPLWCATRRMRGARSYQARPSGSRPRFPTPRRLTKPLRNRNVTRPPGTPSVG